MLQNKVTEFSTPLSFSYEKRPPAAYFFLACQKKVCKKETLGTRNSAYAPDSLTFGLFAWLVSLPQPIETADKKQLDLKCTAFVGGDTHIVPHVHLFIWPMWASATTALNRTNIVRIPYAKYSTGANRMTSRRVVRLGNPIRRPPEGRSLRDALSANGTQKQNAFSGATALFRVQTVFSSISFLP